MITCNEAKDAVKRARNWEQPKDILGDIENSIMYKAKQGEDYFDYYLYDYDNPIVEEICRTLIDNGFFIELLIQKNRPRQLLRIMWHER